MDESRRTADSLRSTSDLTEYFRTCRETGDLSRVDSALRDMPDWATFRGVCAALRAAGLRQAARPMSAEERRPSGDGVARVAIAGRAYSVDRPSRRVASAEKKARREAGFP